MEFSRQEYWSREPFPSPGDLPDPEIEPTSLICLLHCQAASLPPRTTWEVHVFIWMLFNNTSAGFIHYNPKET